MNIDYVINFEFDEVNAAVLRNAGLYIRKRSRKDTIGVIVPYHFKTLFSHADVVVVIDKEVCRQFGIDEYRNILEFGIVRNASGLLGWIKRKLRGARDLLCRKTIQLSKLLGNNFSLDVYNLLYVTPRQKKFYIHNGLEKYCLARLPRHFDRFRYFRVGAYVDAINFSIDELSLGHHFFKNFKYLYTMIEDSQLYHSKLDEKALKAFFLETLPPARCGYFDNFISGHRPKVIFRTRNFTNKQQIHNSKFDYFKKLAQGLLAKGVMVLNIGCPMLSLDIKNDLYCEMTHAWPFEVELGLCQAADANVMTSEAGLFTGFAASLISIVQVDDEWSVHNLKEPVALYEARKKAGLRDIDIRNFIRDQRFDLASEEIIISLASSKAAIKLLLHETGHILPRPLKEVVL